MKNNFLKKLGMIQNPIDFYDRCSACGCRELINVDVDVLCSRCDWMSCKAHVDQGGMDFYCFEKREAHDISEDIEFEAIAEAI